MEVWVEFNHGMWQISPDPVEVRRRTPVVWRFRSEALEVKSARWSVLFDHGSPLRTDSVNTTTEKDQGQQHTGTTQPEEAAKPGHYKYRLRVEEAKEGKELGSVDPHIFVYA
jgi:hypothetical protein